MFRSFFESAKTTASAETGADVPAPLTGRALESILGAGTQFEGTLHSRGAVRLEGKFTGNITALGSVSLNSEADLEGNVVAEAITVGGILHGNVTARRVTILRTGRVWGDLQTEQLATEEGSFIQGIITMQEQVDILAVIGAQQEVSLEADTTEAEGTNSAERVPVEVRITRSNP